MQALIVKSVANISPYFASELESCEPSAAAAALLCDSDVWEMGGEGREDRRLVMETQPRTIGHDPSLGDQRERTGERDKKSQWQRGLQNAGIHGE